MRNPVFNSENWHEILATLSRNKTRTFLTAFGIFWGTAMLAMLWGGASGLEGTMRRNFDGLATNLGAMFPGRTTLAYKGYNKGRDWSLTDHDIASIRARVPGLQTLAPSSYEWGKTAKFSTRSATAAINGITPDFFDVMTPVVYSGRLINPTDEAMGRKVADVGKNIADALFPGTDPIGQYINLDGIYFQVVGVIGQTSEASLNGRLDEEVTVPLSTYRRAYNKGDDISMIFFTAKPGLTPTDIKPAIIRAICANHTIDPTDPGAFQMIDVSDMFKTVDMVFIGISFLALFVGLGSLLSGIIGVGNIMMIIVRERTLEIGVRRALGARPVDIISQILSESMVLTLGAGLLGVSFAVGVLAIADKVTYDPLMGSAGYHLSLGAALGIVAVFAVLGTAAGILPAVRAMKIKPVEAMRDK